MIDKAELFLYSMIVGAGFYYGGRIGVLTKAIAAALIGIF
jgi:hypothetical protein